MMGTVAPPVYGQEWESSGGNIYYNDGNIGVGTTGPSYDLEIQQHVNRGFSVGLGGDNGRIWTEYTNNGPTLVFYDHDDRGIIRFRESPETNDEHNPGHEATIVGRRGNIGIGYMDPPKALSVAGNVLAEEVVVKPQSEWPDFVFEKSHELPPLKRVSDFINEEGHLPNVPSAASVEKDGLSLGEMDATLLQKVEELTLYTIEQKKRADNLEAHLLRQDNRWETRTDSLSRRVKSLRKQNRRQQRQIDELRRQVEQLAGKRTRDDER